MSATNRLPTSTQDLILPEASRNFSRTLTALKRSRLGLGPRLLSICDDAAFAQLVQQRCLPPKPTPEDKDRRNEHVLPLVANERCGSWYISPARRRGAVYFKSTDGHMGEWALNLRRLNLHLLRIIAEGQGCIIVDSTRRGKAMPDALSKTIPIWCAVLNRWLFPEQPSSHRLITPDALVSPSEHAQIEARMGAFLSSLQTLDLDTHEYREILKKPLRPFFAHRDAVLPDLDSAGNTTYPVICCSVSRREHGDGDDYVQGAADDAEHWALGLTPALFWTHEDRLLDLARSAHDESVLEEAIREMVSEHQDPSSKSNSLPDGQGITGPIDVQGQMAVFIASLQAAEASQEDFDCIINCNGPDVAASEPSKNSKPNVSRSLGLGCRSGKLGSRDLRLQVPRVRPFLQTRTSGIRHLRILICCTTGSDLAVGVALTVLCLDWRRSVEIERTVGSPSTETSDAQTIKDPDPDRTVAKVSAQQASEQHASTPRARPPTTPDPPLDKTAIRRQLARIMAAMPMAKPSRATLQAVHAYLLGGFDLS